MWKILVIDDDLDLVEVTKIVLEKNGFKVASANDRVSGMDAVLAEKPDLILLDVMMDEDDDGIVLAQDIRRKGIKTPIIMLSNINAVSGMKFGADSEMVPVNEFVEKPIKPDVLIGKIKALLGK